MLVDYSSAATAVLKRDFLIFLSYRTRLITQIATVFFTLTLFYFISRLVRVGPFDPEAYFAFVVVGLIILGVLTSTLASAPGSMHRELVAGTFERLLVSPLGAVGSLLAMLLFPFAFALIMGAITLIVAASVFGLEVQWSTAPLALPAAILGGLAFAPFGIVLAAGLVLFKQAASAGRFVIAGLSIVAGLYFPVSLLPASIRWTSEVQPFTPAVDVLRHLLVGAPLTEPVWLEVLKLLGFAAVLLPPSIWLLGRAVTAGRARGTITEY